MHSINNLQIQIDAKLVRDLVATQFRQWQDLPIRPVSESGWDNKTFHLGRKMLVRLPTASSYALQVEKEQKWLPILKPFLPLAIPQPIAMGKPQNGYPWNWSIYRWLAGEPAATACITSLTDFASQLAQFLKALQQIDPTDGPSPGPHNFYRGGSLKIYDEETRLAINQLKDKLDAKAAIALWESALATSWMHKPVWLHGDISAGNLLVQNGQLTAVIDFGQLGIGDPACDLMIAWTLFDEAARKVFQAELQLDADTWIRTRAWTLWKALMYIVNEHTDMNFEAKHAWDTIECVLANYKKR